MPMTEIELQNIPRHVAITMDGNGRWAELRGKARMAGHRAGSHTAPIRGARRLGLRELTLYAFSEQNWGRPRDEVDALMVLLQDFLVSEREEILQNTIRLRAIGDTSRLPDHVRGALETLSEASQNNDAMVLTLALSYGGQEEIVDAARALARAVQEGEIRPEDITVATLQARVPSVRYGAPDLMIRTGGEQRVSNFLLWGSAYSELYFSDTLWPDFEAEDLYLAIASYQRRQRRFGLVPPRSVISTNGQGLHACPNLGSALTALIGGPILIAALYLLPVTAFFGIAAVAMSIAAWELLAMTHPDDRFGRVLGTAGSLAVFTALVATPFGAHHPRAGLDPRPYRMPAVLLISLFRPAHIPAMGAVGALVMGPIASASWPRSPSCAPTGPAPAWFNPPARPAHRVVQRHGRILRRQVHRRLRLYPAVSATRPGRAPSARAVGSMLAAVLASMVFLEPSPSSWRRSCAVAGIIVAGSATSPSRCWGLAQRG